MQKAVRAKLETDAQLKEADISVIAIGERNEITLSGTVRTHAAREKAIELAKSAKPGVLVNDKIDADRRSWKEFLEQPSRDSHVTNVNKDDEVGTVFRVFFLSNTH